MEVARQFEPAPTEQPSVLAEVRLQRGLTVEEVAERAALRPDQVEWLETRRLHRFPTGEAAVLALLRYATALGIDRREARRLAGPPVEPPQRRQVGRWLAATASAAVVGVVLTAVFIGLGHGSTQAGKAAAALPVPGRVTVDVLDGSGDVDYTRRLASRVGSFGYRIGRVTRANRYGYTRTVVYFEPGGEPLARRLAQQLGCGTTSPLPAGRNPRRLVVITGPPGATC